jgi:HEAT repeat protein
MRSFARLAPLAFALALAGSLPALAGPKSATSTKAAAPKPLDKKAVKALQAKLAGSPQEMVEALVAAQAAGPPAAALAPDIEALVRRGSNGAILETALGALGALGAPSSSAVLRPYVQHRVPAIRRAAVRALVATKGPEAAAAFREGLRSGDGQVRGFSATGLGAIGAADALPDLFLALDRNVPEAAASIGQLCGLEDCKRFTARLGKLGFDVMTSGIEPILFRQPPLAEDALVEIVTAVRDLGTPEARRYLADVGARWPANGSKKVKQTLEGAVAAIPTGGKP